MKAQNCKCGLEVTEKSEFVGVGRHEQTVYLVFNCKCKSSLTVGLGLASNVSQEEIMKIWAQMIEENRKFKVAI